jgi:two-component system chemotaxis response regulator CheY
VKKVLVVDDSETIRQQVVNALGSTRFTVLEGLDGVDGLTRAQEHPDISLALVDVNMPRMNGLELLDRLKADPATQAIPVLMLTTEVEQALILRAKKAGAAGWLIKPIKPELLAATVIKLAR